MDKAALVTIELTNGAEVLKALEEAGLKISVALWMYSADHDDWRFVLSSRKLDAVGPPEAYGLVHDALEAAGFPLERTPPLMILKMSDPFIRELRRVFGKSKNVEGMRLGGQSLGGRFVSDAYVYRIA
jgi:hypothetical protein